MTPYTNIRFLFVDSAGNGRSGRVEGIEAKKFEEATTVRVHVESYGFVAKDNEGLWFPALAIRRNRKEGARKVAAILNWWRLER
jgi:hypothetical protein